MSNRLYLRPLHLQAEFAVRPPLKSAAEQVNSIEAAHQDKEVQADEAHFGREGMLTNAVQVPPNVTILETLPQLPSLSPRT